MANIISMHDYDEIDENEINSLERNLKYYKFDVKADENNKNPKYFNLF